MRASRWIAIGAVIVTYVFFATSGSMRFARAPEQPHGWDNPGRGYYAQLADGFLQGHAYLTIAPDPAMAALGDPYDYGQRDALQYQFTPPRIAAKFPHVEAGTAQIDKSLAWR